MVATAANEHAPVIERDPAYPSWEAERAALVTRESELNALIADFDHSSPEAAFDEMLRDGFDDAHAQEKADAILAEHEARREEVRKIRLRLSIIKPQVMVERVKLNRDADKGEYQSRLLGSLERIADSLESIAGRLNCEAPKRTRKQPVSQLT